MRLVPSYRPLSTGVTSNQTIWVCTRWSTSCGHGLLRSLPGLPSRRSRDVGLAGYFRLRELGVPHLSRNEGFGWQVKTDLAKGPLVLDGHFGPCRVRYTPGHFDFADDSPRASSSANRRGYRYGNRSLAAIGFVILPPLHPVNKARKKRKGHFYRLTQQAIAIEPTAYRQIVDSGIKQK
jgi:hypothetical protein